MVKEFAKNLRKSSAVYLNFLTGAFKPTKNQFLNKRRFVKKKLKNTAVSA